jgi:hypothetical protein
MNPRQRRPRRSGNILVLTALMMVVLFALVAFAVDLGYLHVVSTELQRSADAAALAAAWELLGSTAAGGGTLPEGGVAAVQNSASQFSALNIVGARSPLLAESDVQVGYLSNPSDPNAVWQFDDPSRFNAVRVRIRKTSEINGEAPLFFARVLGATSCGMQGEATAAFLKGISGFQTPSDGSNLDILPFALDWETYEAAYGPDGTENNDGFQDNWTWVEPGNGQPGYVTSGSDGIVEVNLFPQGTGSPGNRGTVDIGSSNNSTADLARQILYGISPADLAYHGGTLEFDENGELVLNGDTGISAGMKDELQSIIGKPRCIPLFTQVVGPGNNAMYTITGWMGVRILEVKLTGSMSSKRVIIQPAPCLMKGGIPSADPQTSHVYSPVWLVR